ncbi:BgTH12-07865 [Blumeria graminis f. sp. triticale]|uniref:Bgt-1772 n=3 Tax=Blumeria graminis TaxID=34373 RepID=A0A381L5V2_BLUGR|nr:Subunit of the RES complex [Blumeria graminis f. sp. tritici 96224]CAD6498895.1 BgTH12-07865 [Blumeria graminis f. sp. triticale]VCU39017.1 Bgt-1772 [Blumeria graminis f. sp. tritici]
MSLTSYLAAKYLNAEASPRSEKKRKRSQKRAKTSGLVITDDDAVGCIKDSPNADPDQFERPLAIASSSIEYKRNKTSTWKKIDAVSDPSKPIEPDEVDRIVAQTAAENSATQRQDESPVVIENEVIKMSNGSLAGLQRASAVAKLSEQKSQEELAAWEAEETSRQNSKPRETVFRDATGRRIDLVMRRQEALREADAKAAQEREQLEAQKGDYQRLEKLKNKEKLEEARLMPVARNIDDESMNKELKEKSRWNDPATQFLQPVEARNTKGRPQFAGHAAPNRYGIRPGHKWDGVDRSNGWEAQRFKSINRSARNKELDYSWQMDE